MNYIYNDLSKQANIITNTKYLLIPSTLIGFHNTETTITKSVSKRDVYCHIGHLTIQEHERICSCGTTKSQNIPFKAPGHLITESLYAYTRNFLPKGLIQINK